MKFKFNKFNSSFISLLPFLNLILEDGKIYRVNVGVFKWSLSILFGEEL